MARLGYTGIMSLDGYIADAAGSFDWSMPDEQVHAFINDLERDVGTQLYGRRTWEILEVWEHMDLEGEPDVIRDFAEIWRAADKIVYSTTLDSVSTPNTTLERNVDAKTIQWLKSESSRDVSVSGADLAESLIRLGLVDDYHMFVSPVVVGGGTRFLPDGVRLTLDLIGERCFENGTIYLHYRDTRSAEPLT